MKLFGLLIFLIGTALLIVGQRMFWIRQLARLRGCVLDGEIVKWKRIRIRGPVESSASRSMFCAVVSYTDPAGVQRTKELGHQHTPQYRDAHPVGTRHPVLFDPKHPERPLDTTWTTAWFLPGLLSSCGLLVSLIGLGVAFG
jgi:hypothetical protein